MPECHNCPVAKDIAKYGRARWEKTPCAECVAGQTEYLSHHGRTHVRYDPEDKKHDEEALGLTAADTATIKPYDEAFSALANALRGILLLPRRQQEAVMRRLAYPEKPLRVIGDEMGGITASTVHGAIQRARESWPALAAAIPMRTRKKKGR